MSRRSFEDFSPIHLKSIRQIEGIACSVLENPKKSLLRLSAMEFWGAEVQAGKPLVVRPAEDDLIHISGYFHMPMRDS
ncbi:unnamed protein product [Arabis nemorensis]|uniref:Uncharacterized protein n=1 Tax=Arabis nemorensis TaxID=586526 RepID=A0A565B2T6_9BRAS|nr:unnamed protein product [Arabis nemorensis]